MNLTFSPEEQAFREEVRRFLADALPSDIRERVRLGRHLRADDHIRWQNILSDQGWLAANWPVEHGGPGWGPVQRHIFDEECAAVHAPTVVPFGVNMVAPVIMKFGSVEQQQHYLPRILNNQDWWCQGYSEPGAGSDLAGLSTRAVRDGDHYVLNGSKTFITSGMRADYLTVAVRTGGDGMGGISVIVVEAGTPGFSRTPLQKMGWWCSDTASLYFDDCRVPAENLIGPQDHGFMAIMLNFNGERIALAAQAWALAQVCYGEALAYARERTTFGKPLIRNQVIRHKLVDMRTRIQAVKATLDQLTWRVDQGQMPVPELCMLKNLATDTLEFCANEAVQIFGGAGYLRGAKVERIYRETKVLSIGGGASEIMKDLAARQLGY